MSYFCQRNVANVAFVTRISIRLSFYLSVTLVTCAETVLDIKILSIPYDTAMYLVCNVKLCRREFRGSPQTSALKGSIPLDSENLTNNPQ